MWARNVIQLAYGVPGILSYFLVLYAMYGVRKVLSRNFIVIYTMMAVSNIATWLNAWIYLKMTDEPFYFFYYEWLRGHAWLTSTHNFLCTHFYYVQNIDLLLFTFDRFIAIISMTKNDQWWSKYYVLIIAIVHVGSLALHLALVCTRPSSVTATNILYFDNKHDRYVFAWNDAELSTISVTNKIRIGFGVVVWLACLILNALSRKFLPKIKQRRSISTKTNFLLLSLCIFLTQLLNIVVVILLASINSLNPFTTYEIMYYTSDLFSIGPAVYTLLLPGPIREFLTEKITETLHFSMGSSSS